MNKISIFNEVSTERKRKRVREKRVRNKKKETI